MNDVIQYACHGFHKDLPNGKASGSLTVTESQIEAHIKTKLVRLPLDDLWLELGGANDRLVFLTHPSHPDWRIYTSDRSILKNYHIVNHPKLSVLAGKASATRRRSWLLLAAVVIAVAALPIFALSKMDWVSKIAAKQVPPEWEVKLGQSSMAQYKISHTLMDQDEVDALLKPLTQPLVQAMDNKAYNFTFYIANDSTPNAFALPGGFVVIHSGLILRSDSAEQLLGVLAHEVSHVTEQHGLRNVIGTAGIYVIISAVLGDASGLLATVANAAPFLLSQQYSRKFERQADETGHAVLTRANINPRGLPEFFKILLEDERKRYAQIENKDTRDAVKGALDFLSTHPTSEDRIKYLEALPAAEKNFINLDSEFLRLQESVRSFTENNSIDIGE